MNSILQFFLYSFLIQGNQSINALEMRHFLVFKLILFLTEFIIIYCHL